MSSLTSYELVIAKNATFGSRNFVDVQQQPIALRAVRGAEQLPLIDTVNWAKFVQVATGSCVKSGQPVSDVEQLVGNACIVLERWRPNRSYSSHSTLEKGVLCLC